tara:strand:+ start:1678 stop:2517 length:840 start_codon:yes stop_codon:yes gene_type:complete
MKANSLVAAFALIGAFPVLANTALPAVASSMIDDCEVSANVPPVMWPRSLGPLANATQPIDVEVEMTGRCDADLVILDPRFELASPSGSMSAMLSTSAAAPPAGPLEIPLMGSGVVRLQWRPDAANTKAGSYFASVPLSVIDRSSQEDMWTGFADVSLEVGADLEVAPRNGMNALDVQLGDLRLAQSAQVLFDVSSNSAFSVSTSSASGGVLAHDVAGAEIGVPYDVTIRADGFASNGSPDRIESGEGEVAIEITTSGMEKAMAGSYSDTLTVTFRSEM